MKQIVYFISLLLISIAILSCSIDERVPSSVIPEEQMIDVLVDIHMVESMARHSQLKDNNQRANMFFNHILEKHDITLNQLDSSISWYSKHPTTYIRLYDQVIPRLEKSLETIRMGGNFAPEVKTLTIWEKKNEYQLTSIQNNNLPFRIEENSTIQFSSGDEFELKIQFSGKNIPTTLPLIMQAIIHYSDDTESIFEKKLVTTNPSLQQVLRFQSKPNKEIVMISGDLCYSTDKIESPIPADIRIFNIELLQETKQQ